MPALLLAATSIAAGCRSPPGAGLAALQRFEYERPEMGTVFRVVLYAEDRARADAAANGTFARIDALDEILSDFDPESELSRLSAQSDRIAPTEAMSVSRELWTVLERALECSEASDGAFDVTVGPFVRLWRQARTAGNLPSNERLEAARASVGWRNVALDPAEHTVRLLAPKMRLDLGGIAKGFAVDEALAELARHGIERALVIGGGDMAASGPPPGRFGWRVSIESLDAREPVALELAHAALATSGDTYRFLELDGVRYSHIVDPRTGLGLTSRIGASVLARDGMTADALATAMCVLGPERGLALARLFPGVEARITVLDSHQAVAPEVAATPGFRYKRSSLRIP